MFNASLYFLGAAKALYLQAPTLGELAAQIDRATASTAPDYRAQVMGWAAMLGERIERNGYLGASAEHGQRGLSLQAGPIADLNFVAAIGQGLPLYPGLSYADCAGRAHRETPEFHAYETASDEARIAKREARDASTIGASAAHAADYDARRRVDALKASWRANPALSASLGLARKLELIEAAKAGR